MEWTKQRALNFLNELRHACPIPGWYFCLDSEFLLHGHSGSSWIAEGAPRPLEVTVARISRDADVNSITRYFSMGDWGNDQTSYRITLHDGRRVTFLFPLEVTPKVEYQAGYAAGLEAVEALVRQRIETYQSELSRLQPMTRHILVSGAVQTQIDMLLPRKECFEDLNRSISLLKNKQG